MLKKLLVFLAFVPLLSGCYINQVVSQKETGVILDGGAFISCVGPGAYGWIGLNTQLIAINGDTMPITVEDPQVVTSDNQPVGIKATLQIRRKTDCDSVKLLIQKWSNIATDDKAYSSLVEPMMLQAIKAGTRKFTLGQLLDDRNSLAGEIESQMKEEAVKFYGEVIGIQVPNVALDTAFTQKLQDRANLVADQQTELQRQAVIKQKAANDILQQQQNTQIAETQLKTEQANTSVQVEIAQRAGKVVAAQNQVYSDNPQAFELKRLELYAKIFGDKTVYFIPQGTNLNMFMGPISGTVPVVTNR